jgi:hypothetical protein
VISGDPLSLFDGEDDADETPQPEAE